jgi:hypothetical protein
MLSKYDINHDGKLDADELKNAVSLFSLFSPSLSLSCSLSLSLSLHYSHTLSHPHPLPPSPLSLLLSGLEFEYEKRAGMRKTGRKSPFGFGIKCVFRADGCNTLPHKVLDLVGFSEHLAKKGGRGGERGNHDTHPPPLQVQDLLSYNRNGHADNLKVQDLISPPLLLPL